MNGDLAQDPATDLLKGRQRPTIIPKVLAYGFQTIHQSVAGQLLAGAEIVQKLLSSFLPRPFLHLKTQTIHFFVKKPLRISIASEDPALIRGIKESRQLRGVKRAPGGAAAGQPGKILRFQDQETVAAG